MRFRKRSVLLALTALVALIALIAIGGYFALSMGRSSPLAFRDRAYPQGFRELLIEGPATRFDPVLGLQNGPGTQPGGPKRSAREICDALFRDPGSPATGSPDSRVQIAEFFDYRCPYCKTLTRILSDLQGGNIRIVYKEWPILGEDSVLAARAALAAARQDQYLALHTRLMNSRLIPTAAFVDDLASDLGIDKTRWRAEMKAEPTALALQRNAALASELGFSGTPVLVVGRTIVQGAITRAQLKSLIANEAGSPKVC